MAGVIAAIEALAVALATLLIVTGLAVLVWWLAFGLAAEPSAVFGAAGAVWLLAHFVPLTITLSPEAMQAFGFAPEALDFTLSLAPLGVTLVTAVFAARSGWRFGNRGGSGVAGVVGGMLAFAAAAGAIETFVSVAAFPIAGTAAVAAALYGSIAAIAFVLRAAREKHPWWLRSLDALEVGLARAGVPKAGIVAARTGEAFRIAAMLLLGYVGLAGVAAGLASVLGFADVTALSQSLQLGTWGTIMMFVAQLALLPVFVLWSGAWLTGAGFAVGTGTSASPFGALLGPLPGLPLLAAIPDGWGALAILAPLCIMLVAVVIGISLGESARRFSVVSLLSTVIASAALAGLAVVLLSWVAGGSAGPGRLAVVGPESWLVGGLAAGELGVGAVLGALAARADLIGRASTVVAATPLARASADDAVFGSEAHPNRAAVDPNDQPTLPVEFDIPVIPFVADARGADRDSANAHSAGPHDADQQDTDVIVDDSVVETNPREPELFDQHMSGDETATGEAAERTEAAHPAPGQAPASDDPTLIDADALIEAYSWDNPAEPLPEEKPTGWRWRRKKG